MESSNHIRPDYYRKPGVASFFVVSEALMEGSKDNLEAAFMFNIGKYLYRYNQKGDTEDLKKAQTYLQFLIEHRQPNNFSEEETDSDGLLTAEDLMDSVVKDAYLFERF